MRSMLRCLSWPLAFCLAAAAALAQGLLPVPALTGRVIDQTATLAAEQRALERDEEGLELGVGCPATGPHEDEGEAALVILEDMPG